MLSARIVHGPNPQITHARERLWFVECDGHLFATLNEVSDLALYDVQFEWRRELLRIAATLPAPMDRLSLTCRIEL